MITYRPSIGNNETKVGVTNEGSFFGKSTGGKVLLNIRSNEDNKHNSYYKNNYTDLSNESNWFFKSITDTDFLSGSITYRAIYIGASERFDENEIIGNITTSISNDLNNTNLNNIITIELWNEGFFTELSSEGSINLQDENDRYDQLSSATWSSSINYTNTLLPGQFIKVWIKVTVDKDPSLTVFDNFNYSFRLGDITFTVRKTPSRLSYNNLFKVSLKSLDDSLVLKEAIPADFGTKNFENIFKVIKKDNYVNLFFITDCEEGDLVDNVNESTNELRLMVAKIGDNLGEYKFIDVPLSPLFDNAEVLTEDNYNNYLKVMTCDLPVTISVNNNPGVDYLDQTIAISTSGANNYITQITENLPNKKFIQDIFISKKDGLNYAYVFYAEIHTDYTTRDVLNYQHIFFKWVFKVCAIDLSHINDKLFAKIDFGYENKHTSLVTSYYDEIIKSYFYPSSIIMKEDLFTISGFETEDCYTKDHKSRLLFIWEKDLISRKLFIQESDLPSNEYSQFRTVENLSQSPTILTFDNISQVDKNTTTSREYVSGSDNSNYLITNSSTVSSSYDFINMGPIHGREVNHGNSSVTYDIDNSRIKEFTSTWAFSINGDSLGVSGDKVLILNEDALDTRLSHSVFENDFNSISGSNYVRLNVSDYEDTDINIFSYNCQNDVTQKAINISYNFHTEEWTITRNDNDNNTISEVITGANLPKLIPNHQSVITADIFMHEVSGGTTTEIFDDGFRINNGCLKRNIINYRIFVNGLKLTSGTTSSLNNIDIYQITHNPESNFNGKVSYWELRKPVEDINSYVNALHRIHLNLTWSKLDSENKVNSINSLTNNFNYKTKISIENLPSFEDEMLVPIVLYGSSYSIKTLNNKNINKNVARNTFDFNKLSLNKKSFKFFVDKTLTPIESDVQNYDFENDILVIWVKLNGWSGGKLQMFYSDALIDEADNTNIYKNFYGVWRMERFVKENIKKFSKQKLFDSGEITIVTQKNSDIFITLINNIVRFGNSQTYKSNYFDIEFDDITVKKQEMPKVQEFIRENAGLFKPGFMEIRDVKSLYDYKLEINNTGDN
jgi:hypothetical protein